MFNQTMPFQSAGFGAPSMYGMPGGPTPSPGMWPAAGSPTPTPPQMPGQPSSTPNKPAWASTLGPDGWPAFLGDMGGIPAPGTSPVMGANGFPAYFGDMGKATPSGAYGSMGQGSYSSPTFGGSSSSPGGWGAYSAAAGTNPYLQSQISGLQQQYNNNLTRNALPAIQSGAAAVGGIGGSRQGIAQELAIGDSQAGFANAAANLMGQDYENSQNRALQAYGIDQGNQLGYLNSDRNFSLGQGGLNNQYALGMGNLGLGYFNGQNSYNLGQGNLGLGYFNGANSYNLGLQSNQNNANQIANNYNLGNQGQMLDFYNTQGSQDIQRYLAGLQGVQLGAQLPWMPAQDFGNMLSQYSGDGTSTQNSSQGGGGMGALGGALGTWQLLQMLNGGH